MELQKALRILVRKMPSIWEAFGGASTIDAIERGCALLGIEIEISTTGRGMDGTLWRAYWWPAGKPFSGVPACDPIREKFLAAQAIIPSIIKRRFPEDWDKEK